jgi:hypothetical protein
VGGDGLQHHLIVGCRGEMRIRSRPPGARVDY